MSENTGNYVKFTDLLNAGIKARGNTCCELDG